MKPRLKENNRRFAPSSRNLMWIVPFRAFKTDLTVYTDIHSRSVKRAVEAGLLEALPGYEPLDKLM